MRSYWLISVTLLFFFSTLAKGIRTTPEAFLSKDSKTVVAFDYKTIRIMDVTTGKMTSFPIAEGGEQIVTTRSNPTAVGDRIAVQYYSKADNFIQIHKLDSQLSVLHKYNTPVEMPHPRFLHLSPDGKYLVLETEDETATCKALVLDAGSGNRVGKIVNVGRHGLLEGLLDPTGRYILFYGDSDYAVMDLSSGTVLFTENVEGGLPPPHSFLNSLQTASFNSDGTEIYLLFFHGWIARDIKTGNMVLSYLNGQVGTCDNHAIHVVSDTNSTYIRSCHKYVRVEKDTIQEMNFPKILPYLQTRFLTAHPDKKEVYRLGQEPDTYKIAMHIYDKDTLQFKKVLRNLPAGYPTSVSENGRYWFFSFRYDINGQFDGKSHGVIYDLELESPIFQW